MKIAIIGIGNVGGALARKWSAQRHEIRLGVRDPKGERASALLAELGARATAHLPAEAVASSDVVVLATPWESAEDAVRGMGDLSGRVLIDCTNPLAKDLSGLTHGHSTSGGELVQAWAKGARVVKCFNTVGFNIMQDPIIENRKIPMYFCGDDPSAREIARGLAADVGFEPVDAGALSFARVLEPFALLWIASAYKFGLGRDFAFSLVRRQN